MTNSRTFIDVLSCQIAHVNSRSGEDRGVAETGRLTLIAIVRFCLLLRNIAQLLPSSVRLVLF